MRQSLKQTLEQKAVSIYSILGGLWSYHPEARISWSKSDLVFACSQPCLTQAQENMPALALFNTGTGNYIGFSSH